MNFHYSVCATCIDYIERRRGALLPEMAAHCDRTGEASHDVLHRYMTGVHDRHMTGFSLEVPA